MADRGQFSSSFGFVLAAAGSAVGLGNIWGFPTQAASHGGAAFLLVYLIFAFLLAYPALMAELLIGRYANANVITALTKVARPSFKPLAVMVGGTAIVVAMMILSFYSIVAGWMAAYGLAVIPDVLGFTAVADALTEFSVARNIAFTLFFLGLTMWVVSLGVEKGIEKWSKRLMPTLLILLVLVTAYVLTQEGAMQGLRVYLVPDFSKALDPNLFISALGQAFFSLSLGVGTMMIYGSYISQKENLPKLGASVTLIDCGIAMLAGLLILPAMYVAQNLGVEIFAADGSLLKEDTLIFTVLPALFASMGTAGHVVALLFFALMTIAALTSSISILEPPVAFVLERSRFTRIQAALLVGLIVSAGCLAIILNFPALFLWFITASTKYGEPLVGALICVFAGWLWNRAALLEEVKAGYPDAENSLFWKIWPWYVRFVCPLVILLIFVRGLG